MSTPNMNISAYVSDGFLTVRFNGPDGVSFLQSLDQPPPDAEAPDADDAMEDYHPPEPTTESASVEPNGNADDDDSEQGPNARGTYSKEYTLRHPEVQWMHRGQGRYLPADAVAERKAREDVPL